MIFTSRNKKAIFSIIKKEHQRQSEVDSSVNAQQDKGDYSLSLAPLDTVLEIEEIRTTDKEMANFLFTLGCYKGEKVTIISKLAHNFVITVKDARYSIDADLARAIYIKQKSPSTPCDCKGPCNEVAV